MIRIIDILKVLQTIAPFQLQEGYDNSGLLVGDETDEVSRALIALDVTEAVVDEAIAKSCDLIISHHPLIFKGIKRLGKGSVVERVVRKAIKNEIAVLCVHTNLDNSCCGVNRKLGEVLGLTNMRILQPMRDRLFKLSVYVPDTYADSVRLALFDAGAGHIGNYDSCSFNVGGFGTFRALPGANPTIGSIGEHHRESECKVETIVPEFILSSAIAKMKEVHPYEEVAYDVYPLHNVYEQAGAGMIGELPDDMSEDTFLSHIGRCLGTPCLRHSACGDRMIRRVAICGGAGAFLLSDAIHNKADAYITGDIKYHEFFDADDRILMVDAGHFETEQFTKELLYEIITKKIPTFAAIIAETNTNSVHYFCKK